MSPLKILVISPFEAWPLSQGSIVRTHFLVQYLLQLNPVWFAFRGGGGTLSLPVEQPVRNSPHKWAQLFNPAFFCRLWRLIRQEDIGLIIVSQLWSGWHGLLLKVCTGKPMMLDNHNVEYVRLRRMGSIAWPLVACLEFLACHLADEVVCVSEADRERLAKQLHVPARKLTVVFNGADINKLLNYSAPIETIRRQIGLAPDEGMVLFFGSLQHRPNAQAAGIILQEIAPRLQQGGHKARIVIAGLGHIPFLEAQKSPVPANVLFTGFVNDITAVIKSADVVIVPLPSGSGTRYKIIESVACGRRVISTAVGAEGLQPEVMGESLIICDEWEAFVKEIETCLAKSREVAPTSAFMRQYDWDAIWHNMPLPGS